MGRSHGRSNQEKQGVLAGAREEREGKMIIQQF
jgi:hypothetical protein